MWIMGDRLDDKYERKFPEPINDWEDMAKYSKRLNDKYERECHNTYDSSSVSLNSKGNLIK